MEKKAYYELGTALALRDAGLLKAAVPKGEKLKPGSLKGGKSEPSAKAPAGEGTRFKALEKKLKKQKGVRDPGALAGAISRAKFGKGRAQAMAAKGR